MHYSPGQKGEDIAEVIILSLILNSDRSGTEKLRKASLFNLFQSPFISNALPETWVSDVPDPSLYVVCIN